MLKTFEKIILFPYKHVYHAYIIMAPVWVNTHCFVMLLLKLYVRAATGPAYPSSLKLQNEHNRAVLS